MEQLVLTSLQIAEFETLLERVVRRELARVLKAPQTEREELIGRPEAAAMLGITLPTLRQYTKRGLLPAYRIGSRVRYKRSEVMASLKKVEMNGHMQRRGKRLRAGSAVS